MRPRALADFRLMYNSTFVPRWTVNIAGLFAFENTPGIDTRHAVSVGNAAAIAHEATGDDKLSIFKNRRHCMTIRGKVLPATKSNRRRLLYRRYWSDSDRIKVTFGAGIEDMQIHPEPASSRLHVRLLAFTRVSGVDEKRHDVRFGD